MYYEETIIDGVLYYKSHPNASWAKLDTPYGNIFGKIYKLEPDSVIRLLNHFCRGCGRIKEECKCFLTDGY